MNDGIAGASSGSLTRSVIASDDCLAFIFGFGFAPYSDGGGARGGGGLSGGGGGGGSGCSAFRVTFFLPFVGARAAGSTL